MAARKSGIELLPQEEWEKTSFGKILKWILGVGRWIVIGTELIVVLVFLSRFKLDRDLTDLYGQIKQKQVVIDAASGFEDQFRFLQKRLATAKGLDKQQFAAAKAMEEIANLTPLDVSLADITITNESVSLNALSLSEQGLAGFIRNLQASPQFDNLIVSNVSSGTDKGVGIQFELKGSHGY